MRHFKAVRTQPLGELFGRVCKAFRMERREWVFVSGGAVLRDEQVRRPTRPPATNQIQPILAL